MGWFNHQLDIVSQPPFFRGYPDRLPVIPAEVNGLLGGFSGVQFMPHHMASVFESRLGILVSGSVSSFSNHRGEDDFPSMYGIFTYIWLFFSLMVI